MPVKKRVRRARKTADDAQVLETVVNTTQDTLVSEPEPMLEPEVSVAAEEIEIGDSGQVKRVLFTKHSIMFLSAFVVVALALVSSGYFYLQYQDSQKLLKDPGVASSKEIEKIVEKIGKLIELPQGEQPTVATVSDINKLKGQEFFVRAQNGDKVLIFAQAKKAYLYRPSTNRLIDVAPVSFPPPQPDVAGASTIGTKSATITPNPTDGKAEEVKVALYNGSGVTGITRVAEAKLTAAINELKVTAKENANSRDYTQTLIVDLTQKQSSSIEKLIETLGVGKRGALPTGEEKPADTDILIILGTDFK